MSCPYSDEELQYWDGVTNAMGKECDSCEDFDCEHNTNFENNPECAGMNDGEL
jgi:hypothetical protein